MPSAYPGSNDTFGVPSSPATTPLASAGDSTRSHTQNHQDLGDAIIALQKNAALLTHDHSANSGDPRATPKLAQLNTHQNPDTDTDPSSLHHTIGTSHLQAAAGDHGHTNYDNAFTAQHIAAYGGSTRWVQPLCSILSNGNRGLIAGDVWQDAQFGIVDYDSEKLQNIGQIWYGGTVAGNGGYMKIPINGFYEIDFNVIVGGVATHYICRVVFSAANTIPSSAAANNVCSDLISVDTNWGSEPINLHARSACRYLTAGERLYFSIFAGAAGATCYATGFGENRTMATLKYVAAATTAT